VALYRRAVQAAYHDLVDILPNFYLIVGGVTLNVQIASEEMQRYVASQ
jgi:hypothetical protein